MDHPAYQQAYQFTNGLIDMMFSIQWFWMPFLILAVILGVIKWLYRQARRSPSAGDYEDYAVEYRGSLDRAGSRWRSFRDRGD